MITPVISTSFATMAATPGSLITRYPSTEQCSTHQVNLTVQMNTGTDGSVSTTKLCPMAEVK